MSSRVKRINRIVIVAYHKAMQFLRIEILNRFRAFGDAGLLWHCNLWPTVPG